MEVMIRLDGLGKKFIRDWIFRDVTLEILPADKLVILGSNGSGKSTLLQSIAGFLIPTKGKVSWLINGKETEEENIYQLLSMASPYMELIEDFTLAEMVGHQKQFKAFQQNFSADEVTDILQLRHAQDKFIKNFSSGMKQRLKLGLAVLADCPVLLLDEPCTNLDLASIDWYKQLIQKHALHKTIIVCSNEVKDEYFFCKKQLHIEDYKLR